jgi:hypothetical protein
MIPLPVSLAELPRCTPTADRISVFPQQRGPGCPASRGQVPPGLAGAQHRVHRSHQVVHRRHDRDLLAARLHSTRKRALAGAAGQPRMLGPEPAVLRRLPAGCGGAGGQSAEGNASIPAGIWRPPVCRQSWGRYAPGWPPARGTWVIPELGNSGICTRVACAVARAHEPSGNGVACVGWLGGRDVRRGRRRGHGAARGPAVIRCRGSCWSRRRPLAGRCACRGRSVPRPRCRTGRRR